MVLHGSDRAVHASCTWTFALAWVTLFKNRTTGGQAGWMENLGFTIPNWLSYGRLPIILIFAVHFSPFVIMLIGNALKSFDTTLEESSRLLGASRLATTFRIVIPILRPALISAVTLMLAKILGEFGVAYILGLPVNMNVLATSLYRNVYSDQKGSAAVMVAAIVLIGALSLWVDTHFLRESKRFVTISGKSGSSGAVARLGRSRWVATLACTLLFTASVAIPIVVLALSTVMRNPGVFTASNFTLDFWVGKDLSTVGFSEGILRNSEVWQSAWNSVWIVGLAALLSGVSGLFVGYVVVRSPSPLLSAALRQLVFFPYLVPGIAFAVAYLSLFSVQRGPIPALYGTAAILVLIYFTEQMPFTSRSGISAMMQLGRRSRGIGANGRSRLVAPVRHDRAAYPKRRPGFRRDHGVHLRDQEPQPRGHPGRPGDGCADHAVNPSAGRRIFAGRQRRGPAHRPNLFHRYLHRAEGHEDRSRARNWRMTCPISTCTTS